MASGDREIKLVIKAQVEAQAQIDKLNRTLEKSSGNASALSKDFLESSAAAAALNASAAKAAESIAKLSAVKDVAEKLKEAKSASDALGASAKTLTDNLTKTKLQTEQVKKAWTDSQNAVAKQTDEVKRQREALRGLRAEQAALTRVARNTKPVSQTSFYTPASNSALVFAAEVEKRIAVQAKTLADSQRRLSDLRSEMKSLAGETNQLVVSQDKQVAALKRVETSAKTAQQVLREMGATYDTLAQKTQTVNSATKDVERNLAAAQVKLARQQNVAAVMSKFAKPDGGFASPEDAAAFQKQAAAVRAAESDYRTLAGELNRYMVGIRQSASLTETQTKTLRSLGAAAGAAAKELERQRAVMRRMDSAGAMSQSAGWTGLLGNYREAFREFYGTSRQTMSVFQRLRGEVISLTMSFAGLYGIVSTVKSVLNAYMTLQAAEQRIAVVNNQDLAKSAADMAWIQREADRLGITMGVLSDEYSKFAVAAKMSGYSAEATRKIFTSLAEAGRVNHNTDEQMSGIFLAMTQMISKGKIASEELRRQLGDRMAGAFNLFATALGMTSAELDKAMSTGQVVASEEVLLKVADRLTAVYGSQLPDALKTITTSMGRFTNSVFKAQLAVGKGGLIEALSSLFNTLSSGFESDTGQDALLKLGAGFSSLVRVIDMAARNWSMLSTLIGGWVAFKVGVFVIMRLSSGVGILTTGFKSAAIMIRAAALEMSMVSGAAAKSAVAMRVFGVALKSAVPLLGALVIGYEVLEGLFGNVKIEETTEAFERHDRIMNRVLKSYEELADKTKDYGAALSANLGKGAIDSLNSDFANLLAARDKLKGELGRAVSGGSAVESDAILQLSAAMGFGAASKLQQQIGMLGAQLKRGTIDAAAYAKAIRELQAAQNYTAARAFLESFKKDAETLTQYEAKTIQAAVAMKELGVSTRESAEIAERSGESLKTLANGSGDVAGSAEAAAKAMTDFRNSIETLKGQSFGFEESKSYLKEMDAHTEAMKEGWQAIARSGASWVEKLKMGKELLVAGGHALGGIQARNADVIQRGVARRGGQGASDQQTAIYIAEKVGAALKISAKDILTMFSYETGGRLRGDTKGGKGGQYLGYIQFSPANQAKYGINENSSPDEWVRAVVKYMLDHGIVIGKDTIRELYAAVNSGNKYGYGRSDAKNGGMPGTVDDKLASSEWAQHSRNADALLKAQDAYVKSTEKVIQLEQKQSDATAQRLSKLREEVDIAAKKSEGLTREAYIEKELQAARRENSGITKAQLADIAKMKGDLFDMAAAEKSRAKFAKELEKAQNRLTKAVEEQEANQDKLSRYRDVGDSKRSAAMQNKIDEGAAKIAALTSSLREALTGLTGESAAQLSAFLDQMDERANAIAAKAKTQPFSVPEQAGAWADASAQGMQDWVKAIVDGQNALKSLGQISGKVFGDMLLQMGQILIKAAMLKAFTALFGGFGGGGSFFGLFHSGGVVGSRAGGKQVSPLAFMLAPRYHSGGVAGLAPDEIPAILQRGEEVLTRNDPRHRFANSDSANPSPVINISNYVDMLPAMGQLLNASTGTLVNIVQQNAKKFKSAMGVS